MRQTRSDGTGTTVKVKMSGPCTFHELNLSSHVFVEYTHVSAKSQNQRGS